NEGESSREEVGVPVTVLVDGPILDEPAGRSHISCPHLLREAGQLRQGQFHRGDGQKSPASLVTFHDPPALQATQRLPDGGPADVEDSLQVLFGGKGVAGCELALLDQGLDGVLHGSIESHPRTALNRGVLEGQLVSPPETSPTTCSVVRTIGI